ncbi:DUF3168 domain-containing protein [Sphingomonas montanisoli]|uniref:DUF3168 domain-containing protein n=1 Tax=Sphingomonas montanisoli TaxID=2606412 RepID=A0A5D9C6E8_9SPHN|nr:DUF3168 domain-containing protein [Sphingomonas montanisoli]TZG25581.1 DUF3168 domain-containing protein [Sphingomonas montanisoli]
MASDRTLGIRRAILIAVKAAGPVTAIVPSARIFPQQQPANAPFPFIRLGAPSAIPVRAACVDGGEVTIAVHAFANGGPSITAEDQAHAIGATLASALDGRSLDLGGGAAGKFRWTGSQLLQDPEEVSAFHAVVNFRVRHLS